MCVSLHAAELSGTCLMGNVITDPDGTIRHVIGYQNTAQNKHAGANAMVLPIPTSEEVGPGNFLDTSYASNIFRDMVEATTKVYRSARQSIKPMTVFDHGVYTIAVGRDVTEEALTEALSRVPQERRPELNWDVLGVYPELYPDWPLAFFCFNTREAAEAGPLLYHYEPLDPSSLFLPALDAHTGRAPVPGAPVEVDHHVIVGHSHGAKVNYRDELGDLATYLPKQVLRERVRGIFNNGDFTVATDSLTRPGPVLATRTHSDNQFHLKYRV